jgi:DMSO/TMAO reductase YedYZ molybdopterin-dependent catalytic subunit
MKKKYSVLVMLVLAAVLVLAGCGGGEEVTVDEPVEEPIALLISGNVGEELTWTMEELQTMNTIEVDYTGKDGETETYTGVSLSVLLGDADPGADAETVVFTAADDYQAEAALGEVLDCADCIVAFDDGSLRVVMPGFSGKLQVKNLVQIGIQ